MTVTITPVAGLGEVRPGADLAALIAARADLVDGDVLVVAQKVVSKAEGALEPVAPGESVAQARRRIAREQARRVVVDTPWVLVVETHHGWICANAGVDSSNVDEGWLVRLPDDPDASARRLRSGLAARGVDVGVVIADTFGRPWRRGQTEVAIGLAGVPALRDERGSSDRSGRALEVTEAAIADELAATADLVRTKASGVPAVVVRGLAWTPVDARAAELQRPLAEDLFPRGRGMLAGALASTDDAGPPPGRGDGSAAVGADDARLCERVAAGAGARLEPVNGAGAPTVWRVDGDRLAAGAVVAALLDLGYRARWRDTPDGLLVEAGGAAAPERWQPVCPSPLPPDTSSHRPHR